MKKGYTKVFIIEAIMMLVLLLNSFIYSFMTNYSLVLFLFLSLCLFKIFFNFEKDKHRNTSDIIIYVLIYLIIVLIIYYVLGLVTGYVRSSNYYNLYGLYTFILPVILTVLVSEFLRYQLLRKSEGNFKLIAFTTILFILLEVTDAIYYANFYSAYSVLVFIGLTLLPSICKNIFSSYTSAKTGYKPAIVLNLALGLYRYLLPIIPDFNEYLQSMFSLIILTILTLSMFKLLKDNTKDANEVEAKPLKKKMTMAYIAEILITVILVYFVSGYFKYYAIAIASDSMAPTFNRGSVVIIRKVEEEYSELKVGDVIAYQYQNTIIAHRIVKITEVDKTRYFYTQGDANMSMDNYVVREEMILGVINTYIPFIGYPTVLINELTSD